MCKLQSHQSIFNGSQIVQQASHYTRRNSPAEYLMHMHLHVELLANDSTRAKICDAARPTQNRVEVLLSPKRVHIVAADDNPKQAADPTHQASRKL